jgi:hypothetical protein
LWYLAEGDLLAADNRYILTDTGQGLHRCACTFNVLFVNVCVCVCVLGVDVFI